MSYKLYINDNEGIIDPTPEDIGAWIDALNEDYPTTFYLELEPGTMTISNINTDRVQVGFSSYQGKGNWQRGLLTDPDYTIDDGEIEYVVSEQVNYTPVFLTITKAAAEKVAIYYLQNEALPSGLVWQNK